MMDLKGIMISEIKHKEKEVRFYLYMRYKETEQGIKTTLGFKFCLELQN